MEVTFTKLPDRRYEMSIVRLAAAALLGLLGAVYNAWVLLVEIIR